MVITAKFASVCPCCSVRIHVGTKVEWSKGSKAVHVACAGKAATPTARRSYGRSRGYGGPLAGGRWRDGSADYYASGQYDEES